MLITSMRFPAHNDAKQKQFSQNYSTLAVSFSRTHAAYVSVGASCRPFELPPAGQTCSPRLLSPPWALVAEVRSS